MRRRFMILSCLAAVLTLWGAGVASAATRWAIQATPNPSGAMFPSFNDVSCASATSCTAVGVYTTGSGISRTLAEHWNGSKWAIQTTPDPSGAVLSVFYDVSCASAASCTAVGRYDASDNAELTLAERWNGSKWAIQATPSGPTDAELTGVSCISATSCTAAGFYSTSSGTLLTLAEHWNGTTWSIQAALNPSGSPDAQLEGISCTSATSCTAAGLYTISSGPSFTLAEHR